MNISLVNHETYAELLLDGRLDTNTAPEADTIFLQAAERFDKIVLNFEYLQYVSSAGLRVLKRLYIALNKKGGTMTIKSANKMIMDVFEMTGFSALFKFE